MRQRTWHFTRRAHRILIGTVCLAAFTLGVFDPWYFFSR